MLCAHRSLTVQICMEMKLGIPIWYEYDICRLRSSRVLYICTHLYKIIQKGALTYTYPSSSFHSTSLNTATHEAK